MPEVFKNTDNLIIVDQNWITRLKEEAKKSTNRRARLLMHRSHDDLVQEMLIIFCKDCIITPNRSIGKSESLQVIEGEVVVVVFDDEGRVAERIEMGPPGSNMAFMYRLCSAPWHSMIPMSEFVVIHEALEGPFVKSEDLLPSWVPEEPSKLRNFLQQAAFNK